MTSVGSTHFSPVFVMFTFGSGTRPGFLASSANTGAASHAVASRAEKNQL
jgi:hypothetical protein